MGCSSCATGGCSTPAGCGSNGGCLSGGCNKMNTFDWLGNMSLPGVDMFEVVEIRFKGGRKEFFRNTNRLFLTAGNPVVVEMQSGHHIGHVALQGELVRIQMRKRKVAEDSELPIIYRVATDKDLERYEEITKREMPTMFRTRQIISDLKLNMKLSDVEYQADNTKGTFYYSADERVDFRELIKLLAGEFKIRVEMRQISLRQEAGRVGGVGSCGRELCCSTWLTDFQSVSTSAARYQNLSLNPSKLSGQCGRLKCCLNYELETYQDALIDIPEVKEPLRTRQGLASLQKVDIFKKVLWFSIENESNWFPVEAERVFMIMEMNGQGREPDMLLSEEMLTSEQYKGLANTDIRRNTHSRSRVREEESEQEETTTEEAVGGDRRKKKRRKRGKGGAGETSTTSDQANNGAPVANSNNRPKQQGNKHASRRRKGPNPEGATKEAAPKVGNQPKIAPPAVNETVKNSPPSNSNRNKRHRGRGKAKPFNRNKGDNGNNGGEGKE